MSASIQLADEETGEIPEPIVCAVNPNESMFLVVFSRDNRSLSLRFPVPEIGEIHRKFQDYAELM